MKRIGLVLAVLVILSGCTGKREEMDRMMQLRATLLGCEECSFQVQITADYGDCTNTFGVSCLGKSDGSMTFCVTQPESISGITGSFTGGKGELTFDDAALAFPLLADGQITPVASPWVFFKTLLGGYLTACTQEGEYLHLTIDDSFEENALQLEIWLTQEDQPVQGEIMFDGRRIVTMEIENFEIR